MADQAGWLVHSPLLTSRTPANRAAPAPGVLPRKSQRSTSDDVLGGVRPRSGGGVSEAGYAFSTFVDTPVDNPGEQHMGTPAADDLWLKVAAAVRAQLSEAT